MSTTEIIDVKETLKEQSAGSIDVSKLSDQEKILLNTEQEDDETITTEWTAPEFVARTGNNIVKVVHSIFPNATKEQLDAVASQAAQPIADLLSNIAYYNHAAAHRCLELVRKEHVLQPPTRYTLDFSLTAVEALLNGVTPGYIERIVLNNSNEDVDKDWSSVIPEANEIPVDGIPARFIVYNQIYTGKLCFFSYLSEAGDSHVISDIITFWCNELNGFVHTHRVGFWQAIDPLTGLKATATDESDTQEQVESNGSSTAADDTVAAAE